MKKTLAIALFLTLLASGGVAAAQEQSLTTYRWEAHTNLLVPALNVGVGLTPAMDGHFSLGADLYYPWFGYARSGEWCAELMAACLQARWTFRDGTDPRRRGTGPSLGVSAIAGHFDLGRDFRGKQGEFVAASLDFRWTWAVNKGRWRLGAGVSAGYLHALNRDYVVYTNGGDPYRTGEWSNRFDYWGPLKADVTLTIPFWTK